ncbi:uncharacterized protein PpBr36_05843 [Pyricularia pennisetigena]|uniref:uncharacterized protein n=1 Tax=Pyricularia pennisetigena TaxID=1578925 RepID=UPI00114F570A|nr:uncharacterized protein PpBr36_05843 [Pyricularia pennisetigena]TLS23017.1 hypothetical protein PpBr36_05843 [Pyricularia pennisetigena]
MKAIRCVAWRTSRPSQQQHPLAGPQRALLSRSYATHPSLAENDSFAARLREEMLARPPAWIEDDLSRTRSQLLNLALADYLPDSAKDSQNRKGLAKGDGAVHMPPGHHLVYFPPMLTESELLPDGTDPKHSPGPGFSRRLWAGGSIEFGSDLRKPDGEIFSETTTTDDGLRLVEKGRVCGCHESIADVTVRGQPGKEKVYVDLLREYSQFDLRKLGNVTPAERKLYVNITERRTLVFLRDEEVEVDVAKAQNQTPGNSSSSSTRSAVRAPAPHKPDYSFELTPSRHLLFHFSALSHNAHRIHLDREYCRTHEGHRDLLVHGPLSLVLMLTALVGATGGPVGAGRRRHWIKSIDYRNLAPLYVGETMRVCVRRVPKADTSITSAKATPSVDSWDIWIEGPDGGRAVKASAITSSREK